MSPFLRRASPTGDTTVAQGDSIIFRIEADDGFGDSLSYSWFLNGLPIPGETDSLYTRQFDSLGVDTLVVNVTDSWNNVSSYQWVVTVSGVGVEEEPSDKFNKSKIQLLQNQPNPFHGTTLIRYTIPGNRKKTPVQLAIYDITGQLVEILVDVRQEPGVYRIHWDRKNLASGIYFYRLQLGEFTDTKKLILLR